MQWYDALLILFILMNNKAGGAPLKIQVESIGLPTLSKLIGKRSQLEIEDGTVADVISHIVNRIGRQSRKILLDPDGQLDMTIQVMLNGDLADHVYAKDVILRLIATLTAKGGTDVAIEELVIAVENIEQS